MNKRELIERLTGVEMTLNSIAVTLLYKRCINPDLLNELLDVSDDIQAIRKEIMKKEKIK